MFKKYTKISQNDPLHLIYKYKNYGNFRKNHFEKENFIYR